MFLHKHLARPATALLVAAIGVALLALPATTLSTESPGIPSENQVSRGEASSPSGLLFVENAGQWPEAAHFQVWGSLAGSGMTWLEDDAIWITLQDAPHPSPHPSGDGLPSPLSSKEREEVHGVNLRLSFPGSNPDVRIEPFEPLTTTVSYFFGSDSAQWHSGVPIWGGARYVDIYPGIDLVVGEPNCFWRLEAEPDVETTHVRIC